MSYGERLLELLQSDSRIVALTAENWGPIVPVGLSRSPRFIDTGINEQALVGISAGLARCGRIPFVHALACFLTMRAYEFIRTDIGIPELPVKLVGSLPGFLSGGNGPTHQAIEDLALMRAIPNMRVFCPATNEELVSALPAIVDSPAPWYVRYVDCRAIGPIEPVVEGRAVTYGAGHDVGIVTCGFMVAEAISAARILRDRGVAATVMSLRFIRPLDTAALLALAESSRMVVTIEDHLAWGGLGELVSAEFARVRLPVPLVSIALETWFRPGSLPEVMETARMSGPLLAERILMEFDR